MLKPLKEKFPFEHWHTRGGEFLGKHVQQHEDGRITISQKEYSMSVSTVFMLEKRGGNKRIVLLLSKKRLK